MSKEAIEIIKRQIKQGSVEELYLDDTAIGVISPELKKELEGMSDLMCLSMNNCGLTSLTNFPKKGSLIRLELMENKFPAKELEHLTDLKELQSLSLGCNKISTLQDINPLKKLEALVQLDLSETDLAKLAGYRKSVFELLPHLQVLDNLDVDGNEYEYSSENDDEDVNGDGEDEDGEEEDEGEYDDDDEGDEDDGEEDDGEDDEDDEDEEDEEDDEPPAQKRRR
jgi:Leucine-rich repeat (LRR) protein